MQLLGGTFEDRRTRFIKFIASWVVYVLATTLAYYLLRDHVLIRKRFPLVAIVGSVLSTAASLTWIASLDEFRDVAWPLSSLTNTIWMQYSFWVTTMSCCVIRGLAVVNEYHGQILQAMRDRTGRPRKFQMNLVNRMFFTLQRMLMQGHGWSAPPSPKAGSLQPMGSLQPISSSLEANKFFHSSISMEGKCRPEGSQVARISPCPSGLLEPTSMAVRMGSLSRSSGVLPEASHSPPGRVAEAELRRSIDISPRRSPDLESRRSNDTDRRMLDSTDMRLRANSASVSPSGTPSVSSMADTVSMPMGWFYKDSVILRVMFLVLIGHSLLGLVAEAISGCLVPIQNWPCDNRPVTWFYVFFAAACFCLLMPPLIIMLSSVPDTYFIRSELIAVVTIFEVSFIYYVVATYAPWGLDGTATLALIASAFFTNFVSILFPCLCAAWAQLKARYKRMMAPKTQLDSFQAMLRDRDQYAKFKLSAAQDFCMENIMFYEEYNAVTSRDSMRSSGRRAMSFSESTSNRSIFAMYIKVGARYELNLMDGTRKKVTRLYHENNDKLPREALDLVMAEVNQMMYANMYPRFLARQSEANEARTTAKRRSRSVNTAPPDKRGSGVSLSVGTPVMATSHGSRLSLSAGGGSVPSQGASSSKPSSKPPSKLSLSQGTSSIATTSGPAV